MVKIASTADKDVACMQKHNQLKQHISTYQSHQTDLRQPLRKIEQALLTEHTGFLIGNRIAAQ